MTAPPAAASDGATKYCDHAAVGVLISSPAGLLVFERVRPPSRNRPSRRPRRPARRPRASRLRRGRRGSRLDRNLPAAGDVGLAAQSLPSTDQEPRRPSAVDLPGRGVRTGSLVPARDTRSPVATARPAPAARQTNCGLRGRTAERRTVRRDTWLGASVGPVPARTPAGDGAGRRPGPDRENPLTGGRSDPQRASTTCLPRADAHTSGCGRDPRETRCPRPRPGEPTSMAGRSPRRAADHGR